MANRDHVRFHLRKATLASIAESDGNENLSRRRHAEVKLRLISMSDEELWELAERTADPPMRPVEMSYQEHKRKVEKLRETASDWTKDLLREPTAEKERKKERIPEKVLIIESQSSLGKELASALSSRGFSVACVSGHTEALLMSGELKPDLIIVDGVLVDRDGTEILTELRSSFVVPVFLLRGDPDNKSCMLVVGETDFHLIKLSHLDLAERLKLVLTTRESRMIGRKMTIELHRREGKFVYSINSESVVAGEGFILVFWLFPRE